VADPAPPNRPHADWLSLGPAARLVGVDPDTLRRWSDEGRVDAYLTPGGHRRFDRAALERLVATRRAGTSGRLAGLGATPDRVSAMYARRYAASRSPEGAVAGAIPPAERAAFRDDGRRLVTALLAHLDAAAPADRARAEAQAERLVDDLAARLAASGASLTAAAGFFVAARRPFLAELAAMGRRRALDPDRLSRIYDAASQLLDRLLLRLIASYGAAAARAAEPSRASDDAQAARRRPGAGR
jgi:excisionase family DNA binding protein